MVDSKFIFRVLLGLLAAGAVVAVFGVLLGETPVVWRTESTLLLAVVCLAVLLVISRKWFVPDTRVMAMTAVGLVVGEFLIGLSSIWQLDWWFDHDFRSAELMAIIAGAGAPVVISLRFLNRPGARAASLTGAILFSGVFVGWFAALCSRVDSVWEYTDAFATTAPAAVLCLVGYGTDQRHWRWAGVAASALAAVFWMHDVSVDLVQAYSRMYGEGDSTARWFEAAAICVAYANLCLRCPLKSSQKWLALANIAAVVATAIFLNLGWNDHSSAAFDLERLTAASGILTACGTIAMAVLLRLNQKDFPAAGNLPRPQATPLQASVVCPICQRRQMVGSTLTACTGCGLRIAVILTEPRCAACGYSMLYLPGKRCPECGGESLVVDAAPA